MARFVMEGQKGWKDARMNALIATGVQRDIPIDRRIPIYILYQTAWLDKDGKLVFGPDIYGRDSQLIAAMAKAQAFWLPGMMPSKTGKSDAPKNNAQVATTGGVTPTP